ncbi:hypothetical protein AVEN_73985-1 [Araneus ventricosus]|uniref:Uncharacterized protein n=1 Tax=Araneus ventricosus TaxID=182803 RepID=A0A4Y2IBX9_ARAVE|nr:hypothetical protein AVEN_73985-1 [Araneus ventricosus]
MRQRGDIANEILIMNDVDGFDVGCLLFTDEAHFQMDGLANRQNWGFWDTENPHFCQARSLYSLKITVWAAVSRKYVIGPFYCPYMKYLILKGTLQFWKVCCHQWRTGQVVILPDGKWAPLYIRQFGPPGYVSTEDHKDHIKKFIV